MVVAHDRGDSVALIHAANAAEERARVAVEHLVLSNANIFLPLSNLTDAQRLMLHSPEVLEQLTPLYHGVELIRGLTTGSVHPALLVHAAYLVVMTVVGLGLAGRRMGRLLLK